MSMSSLDTVWARLSEVAVLQFQSESRSATNWSGAGSGIVKVASPAPDALIFEESGEWQQSGGRKMRFSNAFRWTRIGAHLSLEHLRLGPEKPVFLFEMAPDADVVWRDVNPHPCRDDFYSATLRLDPSRLFLD